MPVTRLRWTGPLACVVGIVLLGTPHAAIAWEHLYCGTSPFLTLFDSDAPPKRPEPGGPTVEYDYFFHEDGTPDVVDTVEFADLHNAFAQWDSIAGSNVNFNYMGTKASFSTGRDGDNDVGWIESGWIFGSQAIAVTAAYFDAGCTNGEIQESNLAFNGQDFPWSAGGPPGANDVDVWNIAAHEIGHMIGLGHPGGDPFFGDQFDSVPPEWFADATMYAFASRGETAKRTLHQDDRDGFSYLYPATEPDVPPPTGLEIKRSTASTFASSVLVGDAGATTGATFHVHGYGFLDENLAMTMFLDAESSPAPAPPHAGTVTFVNTQRFNITGFDMTGLAAGVYGLVITNPNGDSFTFPGSIMVNQPGNVRPTASAGPDQSVETGDMVQLNGGGSSDPGGDGDGDNPLVFMWTVMGAPTDVTVTLTGAGTATPSFTPTVAGEYVFRLVVNDGIIDSLADLIFVSVSKPPGGGGGGGRAVTSSGGGGGGGGCVQASGAERPAEGPMLTAILVLAGAGLAGRYERRRRQRMARPQP